MKNISNQRIDQSHNTKQHLAFLLYRKIREYGSKEGSESYGSLFFLLVFSIS